MKILAILCLSLASLPFQVSQVLAATASSTVCDQNPTQKSIVWAIDTSGSMDQNEYQTQIDGYLTALQDRAIQDNFLKCQCTEVSVVAWSEKSLIKYEFKQMAHQEDIDELIQFFSNLKNSYDDNILVGYQTDILQTLHFSGNYLLNHRIESPQTRLSMTISGDGKHGRLDPKSLTDLKMTRLQFEKEGIIVNGVPIVKYLDSDFKETKTNYNSPVANSQRPGECKDTADFYEREVKTRNGYLEKAASFEDFARAIKNSIYRDSCLLMM